MAEQCFSIGMLKVIGGLFHFILMKHVSVKYLAAWPFGPDEVVDTLNALQVHRESLKAVGDLAGCRCAIQATHLLKIRELRDFHPIKPDFPAQSPSPEGWILPVVFYKANVVLSRVDAQCNQ